MDARGVRGVRLNVASHGFRDVRGIAAMLHKIVERTGPLGWHVQLFTELAVIEGLADIIAHMPVPVVIDHMGLAQAEAGPAQPGLPVLLKLLAEGHCWVKLSGSYRVSRREPDFADAAPIGRAFIAANADQVVWGTDWPHTAPHGHAQHAEPPLIVYRQLDDGRLFDQLAEWADDAVVLHKILVGNPERL